MSLAATCEKEAVVGAPYQLGVMPDDLARYHGAQVSGAGDSSERRNEASIADQLGGKEHTSLSEGLNQEGDWVLEIHPVTVPEAIREFGHADGLLGDDFLVTQADHCVDVQGRLPHWS
jgi:hypothetical protein